MSAQTLALNLTRAAGIEPWLARLVPSFTLPRARLVVLMGLAMWVLVLLSFLGTLHMRRVLRKVPAGAHRERLAQSARRFRRISHVVGWKGHTLLALGVVVTLWGWWVGAEYPWQALVMIALVDIGLLQPCRAICGLFGRVLDPGTTTSTTSS